MNWPFRSLRNLPPASPPFASPPSCDLVEPLLPLYADGMAAPDEMRFVEAHLPGCANCRESLFWMQATHRALAARPVAVPPANLHSRIAEAIAASSAAPVSMRSVRSFTLRPAYAAAASLTVLGAILGHSLLHSPVPSVPSVIKSAPPMVASVPPVTPRVKNGLPHKVLVGTARVKPHQELAARNVPAVTPQRDAAKSIIAEHAPKKTVPVNDAAPSDRVADNAPAPTHGVVPPHASVKTGLHPQAVLPKKLMASANVSPAEKRHPTVTEIIKPHPAEAPLLARRDKEPPLVQVHIDPPTVTPQPEVKTASVSAPPNFLAGANAYAKMMRDTPLAKTSFAVRQATVGATNAIHALDNEHSGYQPAVYTP